MTLPVIVLGAGGHAKVVLDVLRQLHYDVLGVVDPQLHRQKITVWRGIPVLGDDDALLKYAPDSVQLANGIGALPEQTIRARIFAAYRAQGYTFATLVHPSVIVGEGVQLGQGVQVMAGSILQPDVVVGENTLVNTGSRIDHECMIGDHCHIAPGVVLCGEVRVADGCYIGAGAIVVQGCALGENAILGAGTTLRTDLPPAARLLGAKPQSIVLR